MIDFAGFLRETQGIDPYPWQQRLADRCAESRPPAVLGVPTGSGKTTAVDALLWALAVQADRPAGKRTVGVRIVWAIDRRILVDEVHEHATGLADQLAVALSDPASPLHGMAERLARLSSGVPLVATRWRGGLREATTREHPLQPQIITSTVGQVGSRLLFRGYGVGARSLAVDAGLLGCDSTICLDEAHLVEPFCQTVRAVLDHSIATEHGLDLPGISTLTVTATPPVNSSDTLGLDDADHAAIGQRLTGEKRARLVKPEQSGEAARVEALTKATLAYVEAGVPTVACVVNTVAAARSVFDEIEAGAEKGGYDVALLIGAQRPIDRACQVERIRPALLEGLPVERPLVCVATQTFEVGIDADVAALVTESASATALVQRLGRLNRRGYASGQATIVRDEGRWLYSEEEPVAWEWLRSRRGPDEAIDVSVVALMADETRPEAIRIAHAPSLTTEVVELLVQTAPRPAPWCEPDIEPFIRGVESDPAGDVAVCWRSDLRLDRSDEASRRYREMLLRLAPPEPQELLTLSTSSARALLAARFGPRERRSALTRSAQSDADVEAEMPDLAIPDIETTTGEAFAILRGGELYEGALAAPHRAAALRPSDLAPGDIVVLGTSTGGVDGFGLSPSAQSATDVAPDLRQLGTEAPRAVRITPDVVLAFERFRGDRRDEHAERERRFAASRRWTRIAEGCRKFESIASFAGDHKNMDALLDALVYSLQRELPRHTGLALLAADDVRLALRGVGPIEETLGFSEAEEELYADELDDPNLDPQVAEPLLQTDERQAVEEAENGVAVPDFDDPTTGSPRRAWVLVSLPSTERDVGARPAADPPPSLEVHATAVRDSVARTTELLKLPPVVADALRVAAAAHDHGKADPRIQAFFRRGATSIGAEPLAKSEFGSNDPRAAGRARALAGLPTGLRHEIASVAALENTLTTAQELDAELALMLVAGHHGLGRPIPRVPVGGLPPGEFTVTAAGVTGVATGDGRDGWRDGAWVRRFWQVVARYGPWGAAYLEAILILADREVSARGS